MADRVHDRVHAGSCLCQEGGQLSDDRGQDVGATKLSDHGQGGVGTPGQEPEADVGDGYLGNADLGALGILVLKMWRTIFSSCSLVHPSVLSSVYLI